MAPLTATASSFEQSHHYRIVHDDDTLPDVLHDEMYLRGHSQADVARELRTSEANVSRWLDARRLQAPNGITPESVILVKGIMRYCRIETTQEYAVIYFNTKKGRGL